MQDVPIASLQISTSNLRRHFRKLNYNSSQLLIQMMVIAALGISLTISINPISPTSQRPFQQYVFGHENTNVSSSLTSDKTGTGLTFPQIHNFTSTPPAPVNSWIIESENGVVMIDAQRTLSEANNALDEIKALNKPILGVIITHPHPDHIGGTAVLLNRTSNVPIFSTQSTYGIMRNDTGGLIAFAKQIHGDDYPDQVILPNRIVKSSENFTIDRITYSFEDIGPGEGSNMMLIYLPEQKLLFTGDIVNNQMHPALIEGNSMEWIKQIRYIEQNYPDAIILFPGHGQPGSPATLLGEQLEYLNTFRSLVEQQLQLAGESEAERSANITDGGKTSIKSELQRQYPNYLHVALMPLDTMFDLNMDAIVKELNQDK